MGGGCEISHSFSKIWATSLSPSLFPPASLLWTGQPHLAMNRVNVSTVTNPLFYFADPNLKIIICVCVCVCVCVSAFLLETLARARKVKGIEAILCMCLCTYACMQVGTGTV